MKAITTESTRLQWNTRIKGSQAFTVAGVELCIGMSFTV
jgi:hypothetical protein